MNELKTGPILKSLSLLKLEAENSCLYNGHNMKWDRVYKFTVKGSRNAECTYCGMAVSIKTHPQPNEIDIGGNAVVLTCPES